MSSTIGTKDILDKEEDSFALSDMIGDDSFDVELFSFGSIVDLELRQGTFRAALHEIRYVNNYDIEKDNNR